jgi:peptide/nickel transport system substrate-binding protein
MSNKISRRQFLQVATVTAGGAVLAACGAPATTAAPAPATAAPATAAPAPATAAPATAAPVKTGPVEVPRNRTVNLAWSVSSPIGVTNALASPGYTHQEGNSLLNEGLAYYMIYASKTIPWIAESMTYTKPDFTELTVKVRKEAMWSDGTPLTSKDVVYTFNQQLTNDKANYHAQFVAFVKGFTAPDDQTVVVTFLQPSPRFSFEVLTCKFDTGMGGVIVPEHVLSKVPDVNAYAGGLDMPHSGPYTLILWDANAKVWDQREDWWAIKAGLSRLPDAKRVVMTNIGGQVGQNMDVVAQRVVNNEYDMTLDMRSAVIGNILKQNPKVTTHTGDVSPYGYLDWWPNSLWCNTLLAPYSDPNVRKAMSLAIDRDLIDTMLYEGAKISSIVPFPLYPNLVKFRSLPEVEALVTKYNPREFNLTKSATLMTGAGFAKNADGLWAKAGATINCVINGFEGIHSDIVPILAEMLKKAGFDASVNFGTDAYQNMADGKPGLYMYGHGASLIDPYAVFELYNGKFSAPINTTSGGNHLSRYNNPDFNKLNDAMAPLASDDPAFTADAVGCMELYWKDQIDVPIIQWLHRIPYNRTYWANYPTVANPSLGMNGAFWHHTGMLVITTLVAVQ